MATFALALIFYRLLKVITSLHWFKDQQKKFTNISGSQTFDMCFRNSTPAFARLGDPTKALTTKILLLEYAIPAAPAPPEPKIRVLWC